jgi:Fic family protein
MRTDKADIDADIETEDRGEATGLMEPMSIGSDSRHRTMLVDLSVELAAKAAGFRRSLPQTMRTSLANLVRAMNCYYSNLIEGHETHPIDIERALKKDYSKDRQKRDLQLEAEAHIAVQQWIDADGLRGRAAAVDGICETHRRFYELLPDDLKWVEDPQTKTRIPVKPGALRRRNVAVGRHIGISPGAVPRFLKRFSEAYGKLGRAESILSAAAAHHRLAWIHPFMDGNGRVVRLMSHAMLLESLDTAGVWSISRGLARNVEAYKSHLANCDLPRRNDLDGRGTVSEEALAEFTVFFLKTCLDQVAFMENLLQPDLLRTRILLWAEEEIRRGKLPPRAGAILEALLYRGELPRAEIAGILGVSDRQGRRVIAALAACGVISSESARAPLRLAFPASLSSRWMPGLFPEKTG